MLCFQAIKHYLNFSEAAENLYISQSALSKQLKSMEEELGVALFERKYSYVRLTPPGEQVALHVEKILYEYDQMKLIANEYKGSVMKKLRIISFCEMVQYGITDLIISFEQRIGNFYIESRECEHTQMLNLLDTNQTDLIIGYKEFFPVKTKYKFIPLKTDDLVLVVNQQHPLAAKKSVSLEETRDERFCFPREDASLFEFFKDTCKVSGFLPKLTLSDVRLGTIKRYIAAGMRVTLQTRIRAQNFFYEPSFRILNINDAPFLTLSILTNENLLPPLGKQFINFTKEYYEKKNKSRICNTLSG